MDAQLLEIELLKYFADDELASKSYQPVTWIYAQIKAGGRAHFRFKNTECPQSIDDLDEILLRMADDGYLICHSFGADNCYLISDRGMNFLDPSFSDIVSKSLISPLRFDKDLRFSKKSSIEAKLEDGVEQFLEDQAIDSTVWTGLPKSGVLTEHQTARVAEGLRLVDRLIQTHSCTNEERAQARAYFIAIEALANAPEPPAGLIWEILNRANSVAGIASLFVSLIALFQSAAH